MKVVVYCRVSTGRQVQEGLSLDGQEQEGRAWAKANRHRVVAVCRDEGVSGATDLDERDGLAEAVDLLRDGQADALWVEHLDRLARDLMVQESVLRDVWQADGRVFVDGEGQELPRDDPDAPDRRMIRQVLGAVAEYERAMTVLRLRRGRRRKAERGGYAYGSPPFGTRTKDRQLVPDPDEAETVRRIVELRDQGQSLRSIVDTLHTEGRPPKRGDRWYPQTVARVLDQHAEAS